MLLLKIIEVTFVIFSSDFEFAFLFLFAGPQYWGKSHSAWVLCSEGKQQSPIDLRADKLLYDPDLQRFEIIAPTRVSIEYLWTHLDPGYRH